MLISCSYLARQIYLQISHFRAICKGSTFCNRLCAIPPTSHTFFASPGFLCFVFFFSQTITFGVKELLLWKLLQQPTLYLVWKKHVGHWSVYFVVQGDKTHKVWKGLPSWAKAQQLMGIQNLGNHEISQQRFFVILVQTLLRQDAMRFFCENQIREDSSSGGSQLTLVVNHERA